MNQPTEVSALAAELARYLNSANPIEQVLSKLYRDGEIKPAGMRNGQVVWVAANESK